MPCLEYGTRYINLNLPYVIINLRFLNALKIKQNQKEQKIQHRLL